MNFPIILGISCGNRVYGSDVRVLGELSSVMRFLGFLSLDFWGL